MINGLEMKLKCILSFVKLVGTVKNHGTNWFFRLQDETWGNLKLVLLNRARTLSSKTIYYIWTHQIEDGFYLVKLRVIREKQLFNFHFKNPNLVNNTLLRAGRTQSKRKLQNSAWYPFYGWTLFKEKSNTLSSEYSPPVYWMPCRVLEFPWISEVPSNPQLMLDLAWTYLRYYEKGYRYQPGLNGS